MVLSRAWYVLLGLAVAVALYIVYVAVGQYNRTTVRSLKEGLASDSQTVEWALKIDSRRRLDALLVGSVDGTLQQALAAANTSKESKVPESAKQSARKALTTIHDAIPADWREDALFAVDRDGRVVAQLGFDVVNGFEDFELGGYAAVNDALHGWVRDDVWLLGSKMYVVAARPVEYDVAQRPAGAIVGIKEIGKRFADDIARRTRTAVAFYAAGQRVASGVGVEGFDEEKLDVVGNELKSLDEKAYGDGGRSDVRMLGGEELGAMYARLPGDIWPMGGGFAVARSAIPLSGPMAFLANADDQDKKNVPWLLLVGVVLVGTAVGVAFTLLEHALPLKELVTQAEGMKRGSMDGLQVSRFRGSYRLAAQAINEGIDHAIEKAGGKTRKPADLESILGPTPAQPAMSAFSFPLSDGNSSEPLAMGAASQPATPAAPPPRPSPPWQAPAIPPSAPGSAPKPFPAPPPASRPGIIPGTKSTPFATPAVPRVPPPAPLPGVVPSLAAMADDDDDDATMVGAVPAEVMAQATGENRIVDDNADWLGVYEDFVRTKKQCGEPTDGLTFEKFSHTLKKNRDSLIQKHGCKRVKFSVYVKEGRASLKATPVKN
jgi:hypothetical protein